MVHKSDRKFVRPGRRVAKEISGVINVGSKDSWNALGETSNFIGRLSCMSAADIDKLVLNSPRIVD